MCPALPSAHEVCLFNPAHPHTHRLLYPGKYQYKLIVDGNWTYSADHPTAKVGG
jgi:hypothetical protein